MKAARAHAKRLAQIDLHSTHNSKVSSQRAHTKGIFSLQAHIKAKLLEHALLEQIRLDRRALLSRVAALCREAVVDLRHASLRVQATRVEG